MKIMGKMLCWALVAIMAVASIAMISANTSGDEPYVADDIVILRDLFDDGDMDGWAIGVWNPSGTLEVTDTVNYYTAGSSSVHIQSNSGTNTAPWFGVDLGDDYSSVTGGNHVYLPVKSQTFHRFELLRLGRMVNGEVMDGGDMASEYSIWIGLKDDNYGLDIIEYANQVETVLSSDVFTLSPETWYNLNISVEGSECSILVDQTVVHSFTRMVTLEFDYIMMGDTSGSSGGYGECYFDFIEANIDGLPPNGGIDDDDDTDDDDTDDDDQGDDDDNNTGGNGGGSDDDDDKPIPIPETPVVPIIALMLVAGIVIRKRTS